jgi:hypothetical protein
VFKLVAGQPMGLDHLLRGIGHRSPKNGLGQINGDGRVFMSGSSGLGSLQPTTDSSLAPWCQEKKGAHLTTIPLARVTD